MRATIAMTLIFACVFSLGAAAQPVCAPLQGTAQYTNCVGDQLARQRDAVIGDPQNAGPNVIEQPDYLGPDGTLLVPEPGMSLQQRGAAELDLARRNSNLRTNLLQQQIQSDLRQQNMAPPPVLTPSVPFGTGAPW